MEVIEICLRCELDFDFDLTFFYCDLTLIVSMWEMFQFLMCLDLFYLSTFNSLFDNYMFGLLNEFYPCVFVWLMIMWYDMEVADGGASK